MTSQEIVPFERFKTENDEGSIKQAIQFIEETQNIILNFKVPNVPGGSELATIQKHIQSLVNAIEEAGEITNENINELIIQSDQFVKAALLALKVYRKKVKKVMMRKMDKANHLKVLKEIGEVEKQLIKFSNTGK